MSHNMKDFNLKSFAYLPNYEDQIENLKALAREERWDYIRDLQDVKHKILVNYINHTFKRLWFLNKNKPNGNYLYRENELFCFNTGLFTKNFEPIYALFVSQNTQHRQKWLLKGFYKESAYELRSIANLPNRAEYFDNISDLIYDTRLTLRVNIDHILEDENNKKRIPDEFKENKNLPMLFNGAALRYAEIRIKENYKAAVPQYFKGRIQFLIPISLGDPSKVDLSLAVGKEGGIYTGHTCLTLDMAYNNARLIAKPESDWLVE